MNKKFTDFLKEPLSSGRLKLIPSLLVLIASIFVNAYFQVTSFSALVRWFLKTSGEVNVQQRVTEIIGQSNISIGVRIAFGLLMTAFVMVFLLLAAYWEEKDRNISHLFEKACSSMLVPMLLMLAAALLMNISLVAGVILGSAAAVLCVSTLVSSGKKAELSGYVLMAVATVFLLLTAVMLTRNHFVTMLSLI